MNDEIKVKSLSKAMRVLECFRNGPELGISQISDMLGMNKSNVHDIISTFVQLGYVMQNQQSSKYRLGYRILDLSHVLTDSIGFRKTVFPYMQKLAIEANETVYFAIPDGSEVLYLDSAYPVAQMTATRAMLGDRAKMYCTAIGKAILSTMDEKDIINLLPLKLHAYTEYTITDLESLLQDISNTRKRGYAIDNMEHEYGIKCVGTPIISTSGTTIGALSISGPSLRFDDAAIHRFANLLFNTVQLIKMYW